jgi:cytochrome c peroxidase
MGVTARVAQTISHSLELRKAFFNVAFHTSFFWDGRAESLENQALIPLQDPEEMNQSLDDLEEELSVIPGYVSQFQGVFGTAVTRDVLAFWNSLTGKAPEMAPPKLP